MERGAALSVGAALQGDVPLRPKIRLLVVTPHKVLRDCLILALDGEDLEIVGATGDDAEAMELGREHQPDVVLIAPARSDAEDLTMIRDLARALDGARLLLLGPFDVDTMLLPSVRAGVRGYLSRDTSLVELADAVRRLAAGEAVSSPAITRALLQHLEQMEARHRKRQRAEALALTAREMEVLQLIARSASNKRIAQELHLSVHTVKNHVHHILDKLEVESRHEAVQLAQDRGWLTTSDSI